MQLGPALKMCRERRGLTQTGLAAKCQVSAAYLSMIENDRKTISLNTLEKIATALDVPVWMLIMLATLPEDSDHMDHDAVTELYGVVAKRFNCASCCLKLPTL